MTEPFIGTIIIFGGSFPPYGWQTCDGSLLAISQYDALYNLIGTTYGGDGVNTFAVPDMRSRIPVGQTGNYPLGMLGGLEQVTLSAQTTPQHSHPVFSNSQPAASPDPTNNFLGTQTALMEYTPGASANSVMAGSAIVPSTGGSPHGNIMPSLALNYIIATEGIFPPRS